MMIRLSYCAHTENNGVLETTEQTEKIGKVVIIYFGEAKP